MKLKIKIKNKAVIISILRKNKVVDKLTFPEDYNLSEILLPNIDELLKKNRLKPEDVEKAVLMTGLTESFTAFRIARSVVNAFNWSKLHS